MKKIGVTLFNLGGPDSLDSVEPFLRNLFLDPCIIEAPWIVRSLLGRYIARKRGREAQKIYVELGGASPILPNTQEQANRLQLRLDEGSTGRKHHVTIGMRYWKPFIKDAFDELVHFDADFVVLVPLYPQYSRTTTGSSLRIWDQLCSRRKVSWQESRICCYPIDKKWIGALASCVREELAEIPEGNYRLLLSAHGLPEQMVTRGDPYQWQVEQTSKALVAELPPSIESVVCYQSRVGKLPWLQPYTEDEILRAAKEGIGIIVVPVAFVSEHSETLVELDIEYRDLALRNGAPWYVRASTVGTKESYMDCLVEWVEKAITRMENGETGLITPDNRCLEKWVRCPAH